MPKNKSNTGSKGNSKTTIKKSSGNSQIRSTSVNPSSGPKPAPPAKQPK